MNQNTQKFNIVGPCSMESEKQIRSVFDLAQKVGLTYIRTQVYKPRTNPNSFQGLGLEGITILKSLRDTYSRESIKYVCEVCSNDQFDSVSDIASIIQIGARNMQNFELLKYIAQNFKSEFILLKRGFSNTQKEWISSAEYLISGGIPKDKIILCERGSRSFTSPTGVSLDFINALVAKEAGFKVIIDPSHGTKESRFVLQLAKAANAMDFDGLMIEAHPNPSESVSDKEQAISLDDLESFFSE